ncbi:ferredoxin [Amycolatopsis orientalis]|uniref:ferredoxin n=1 Tax=Amycolatopsis orientalis TaxID=31958 RepID=UPI000421FE9B|nr:ferredoxin [Amycolatopsis orientalis]
MTTTDDMLRSHPGDLAPLDEGALARCVEACLACAQACVACADACLSEPDDVVPALRACIRLTQDCADFCTAAARAVSRQTGADHTVLRAVLRACVTICGACARECETHAGRHDHCRVCAEQCRAGEKACQDLLDTLP